MGWKECGLLNRGPLPRPFVHPSAKPLVRPTATLPPPTAHLLGSPSALWRPRLPNPLVRPSTPPGPRPHLFRPSACSHLVDPIRPSTRLSAPFSPSSARLSTSFSPRPPNRLVNARSPVRSVHASSVTFARARPPHPLPLHEKAASIYTPPCLPLDHPVPCSPRCAPSLCCAFKECGTARGSRTSRGWSELWRKPLQFFFCAPSSMERETIYVQED